MVHTTAVTLVLLLVLVATTSCSSQNNIGGEAHLIIDPLDNTIHVINPIIEFCERLYPDVLYPDVVEREENITDCMRLCSESGQCVVDIGSIDGLTTLP